MKWIIRLFLLLLALLVILGLVLAFLPARLVIEQLGPRLGPVALEGVSGTVWSGRADQLSVRGRPLGRLDWKLDPWPLLSARLAADVELEGPVYQGGGSVSATRDRVVELRNMQLRMPAQQLQPALDIPALQLLGTVDVAITDARLLNGFPTRINGSAVWRDAAVTGSAQAQLGEVRAEFASQPDGSIAGTVDDNGGPLAIENGYFSVGLSGVEAAATLRARDGNPQVREALQHVGAGQPDGSRVFELRGSLLPGR